MFSFRFRRHCRRFVDTHKTFTLSYTKFTKSVFHFKTECNGCQQSLDFIFTNSEYSLSHVCPVVLESGEASVNARGSNKTGVVCGSLSPACPNVPVVCHTFISKGSRRDLRQVRKKVITMCM